MNKQKGFSQILVMSLAAVLLIGAGAAWIAVQNNKRLENAMIGKKAENKNSDAMAKEKSDQSVMKNDDSAVNKTTLSDDSMLKAGKMLDNSDPASQKYGSYKDYSVAAAEAEQKAGKKVVLFFHAPWCPFCKAADAEFRSRMNEIPSDVTILKTDYDSNTELKQRYGVTYQHTFVQINNGGSQVSKWNGGDIDNLKKYLK